MNDSFELIYNDLNLEGKETLTDAQLLEIISDRVAWFLENEIVAGPTVVMFPFLSTPFDVQGMFPW